MTQKPTRAVLVSQTHWDRAWYVPFQVYRIRLVRLIDRLLDLLERDPAFRCFTLDGQVLPLADYFELRPERRPQPQLRLTPRTRQVVRFQRLALRLRQPPRQVTLDQTVVDDRLTTQLPAQSSPPRASLPPRSICSSVGEGADS